MTHAPRTFLRFALAVVVLAVALSVLFLSMGRPSKDHARTSRNIPTPPAAGSQVTASTVSSYGSIAAPICDEPVAQTTVQPLNPQPHSEGEDPGEDKWCDEITRRDMALDAQREAQYKAKRNLTDLSAKTMEKTQDFHADARLMEIVNPRPQETTDDFIRRLWGLYRDADYLRYQGQILIRIVRALREAKRFDEALQTARTVLATQNAAIYFNVACGDRWNPTFNYTSRVTAMYRAVVRHQTQNPETAGEWALLELARVYDLQGQLNLARETLAQLASRYAAASYRVADTQFVLQEMRRRTPGYDGVNEIGWVPSSPDSVDRPGDIALSELRRLAERDGDVHEVYRIAKMAYELVGEASSVSRATDLAQVAYNVGKAADAIEILERQVNVCDSVLREKPPSTTPEGIETWSRTRSLLLTQIETVRTGKPWPVPGLSKTPPPNDK